MQHNLRRGTTSRSEEDWRDKCFVRAAMLVASRTDGLLTVAPSAPVALGSVSRELYAEYMGVKGTGVDISAGEA